MSTQDHVWSLRGSVAALTLPVALLEPVSDFVDRYVNASEVEGDSLPLQRIGLVRADGMLRIEYQLPETLFDCSTRRLAMSCLLVEGEPATFEIRPRDGEGAPLDGTDPRREVRGAVDYFDGERVRGWAYSPSARGAASETVGIFVDGQLVAKGEATALRRDLARKGIEGGRAGFQIPLPPYLMDGRTRILCCAPLSTLTPLDGGLIRVDHHSLVASVMDQIRLRIGRLEHLLE